MANLLDNAIKFSPQGRGRIILAAEAVVRHGSARQVVVSVTDEGIGIPEADRGRVVERFFRGETARHTPGSGLGLALVQAVATLHDGSLVLEDARPGVRAVLRLAAPSGRVDGASSQDHGGESALPRIGSPVMRRALYVLVLMAGFIPVSAGRSGGAFGQPAPVVEVPAAPMPVMSDTAEYCVQLEHRIAIQPVRSAEVRKLVSTGHQLCDHGQVRRGVSYMRRALIMQRRDAPP